MKDENILRNEILEHFESKIRDYSYLPDFIKGDLELTDLYTDFILGYLIKSKRGTARFDKLVIKENGLNISLDKLIEKQNATDIGYADIIKETDKYVKLRITYAGIEFYRDHSKKYNLQVVNKFFRLKTSFKKFTKKLHKILLVNFPKSLKIIMESGVIKLVIFLIAILTFILKWKEIKELIHKLTE